MRVHGSNVVVVPRGCPRRHRLADLLRRWMRRLGLLAPGLLIACQDGRAPEVHLDPSRVSRGIAAHDANADDGPKSLGPFQVTFYYVATEEEVDEVPALRDSDSDNADEDDRVFAAAAPDFVVLYEGKTCEPIAEVSRAFAAAAEMQGTGKLKDGRIINIWGACACRRSPCFHFTGKEWGKAGTGRGLQPFRTVAADPKVVPLGSLLYIPALQGRRMPGRPPWGGFLHDGCVVADDTGGAINDNQLDFFVGRRTYYRALSNRGSHAWARSTEVFDGSKICERAGREVRRTDNAAI
jgi:3D (Asp-Asp-Asp) domain-containing protein